MKKITIVALLALSVFCAKAQQNQESSEFQKYSQSIEAQRKDASKNKDYPRAVSVLSDWVDHYNKLSAEDQKTNKGWLTGMYYNLACYQALQGKEAEALNALDKSISTGYANYDNMVHDSDLESLHTNKRYTAALQTVRERGDMNYILQQAGAYDHKKDKALPAFTYQTADAPELVALKNKFNLDSVAGNKDEISRIKNLLFWVHNVVRHDGSSNNPKSKNAIDLIAICKQENRGVNCRMMATILKDAYQAEGFQSRMVTCLPKDTLDNDCHVITVVWSKTLNKWIWMDPTFNAYVTDKKGNLLNIAEVRERLVKGGDDLILNDDANWNNKNKQTKAYYLGYYMSKNLYWLQCATKSQWDLETRKPAMAALEYVNLYPADYSTIHQPKLSTQGMVQYATNNPDYFWQKPSGK